MRDAEAYIAIVKGYFPDLPGTQAEMRAWWASESGARQKYGFTEADTEELADFCRCMLWMLPEGEPVERKAAPRSPPPRKPPRRY